MYKNILAAFLGAVTFIGVAYGSETAEFLSQVNSEDPVERMNGFAGLVDCGRSNYSCQFLVSDADVARKAVIQLYLRERDFNFDEYYFRKHGRRIGEKDIYSKNRDKTVQDYLEAKEGNGIYFYDLQDFVDSCEERKLIRMFPGRKTFNKYRQESVEAAIERIDKILKLDAKTTLEDSAILKMLGDIAVQYRDSDPVMSRGIRGRLIEWTKGTCLGGDVVYVMGQMGDPEFVPILEKIAGYDKSRGCVTVVDGKKMVSSISESAERALKRIKRQ